MNFCLVVGLGVSGKAVYNKLLQNGIIPIFYDDSFCTLENLNFIKYKICFVVVSPSVKLSHPLIKFFVKNNIPVIGEIEYAYSLVKNKNNTKLIGITGTNGKTTVTTMIGNILKDECSVCGNVGIPFSLVADNNKKYYAIELSSYQLTTTINFKLNIACILNLAPDHLEYHGTLDNYYNAKMNIIKNLSKKDYVVANLEDDEIVARLKKCNAQIFYFGLNNKYNGCYIKDNYIFFRNGNREIKVLKIDLKNTFPHNVQNIMAVCTILKLLKISNKKIADGLKSYIYQPYRIELVRKYNGAEIYNDSKSTNVASLKTALKCFKDKRILLLVGGRDKGESFKSVFLKMSDNIKVFVYGESSAKIITDAKSAKFNNYVLTKSLDDAVISAIDYIKDYDILLFSPGCASFDSFNNFTERGQYFNKLILSLK